MDDILSLVQRAKNSIVLGESHFREFKTALEGPPDQKRPRKATAICKEIGEALVAFTNADGGELFIGVEDDGTITGLQHSAEDIQRMLDAVRTHVMDSDRFPVQVNRSIELDGKTVLFFCVTKSTDKIYQLPDGRCMRRQDKSSVPARIEQIQYERREALSREYDRAFVDGATVNDLDIALVQQMADSLLKGMSPEQYLQQVNLAEYGMGGIRLKRAALLLFAKDIARWFPRAQIRIVKINGDEILTGEKYNVIADDYVTGNVFQLLSTGWERLRPYLSQKTTLSGDARFEQIFVYPENACREALVNAIAHRDYSIVNPVTIYIYDSQLVFESPGELLSTISIEDLRSGKGVHESRNSNISRVLRESKIMRELGEGIRRIFDLMKEQELAPPQLLSGNGRFSIAMNHKSIYSEREQIWLSIFDDFKFDQYQKRIIIAGIDGRRLSRAHIYAALGTTDRNIYDHSVTTLRVSGVLNEITSAKSVAKIAKQEHKSKDDIPRYEVLTPDKISNTISNKVFVYDLPADIDRITLITAMSIFGKIVSADLPKDADTGLPRGFAFIEFTNKNDALKAIAIKNIRIKNDLAGILPFRTRKGRK